MSFLRIALVSVGLVASTAAGAWADEGWITVGGGSTVKALNVALYRGWIRVRADTRARVISVRPGLASWDSWTPGTKPGPRRDLPMDQLQMERRDDTLRIAAPSLRDLVMLEVVVPATTALRIRMAHYGDVGVDGALGEMEVDQFRGPIALEDITGPLIAHVTRDGNIRIRFAEKPASRPMAITTYEGDIELQVPRAIVRRLKVATIEGEIRDETRAPGPPSPSVIEPRIIVRNAKGTIHVRTLP